MTQEETLEFNRRCAKFLGYKYYPHPKDFPGWRKENGHPKIKDTYLARTTKDLKFDSDWNWIMRIVDEMEKQSKTTIMGRDLYESFTIGNRSVKFYFTPNNNYLLHLELKQFLSDEPWRHGMYKHHIIQQFDFKTKGKKAAVVEAVNQFLIWMEQEK